MTSANRLSSGLPQTGNPGWELDVVARADLDLRSAAQQEQFGSIRSLEKLNQVLMFTKQWQSSVLREESLDAVDADAGTRQHQGTGAMRGIGAGAKQCVGGTMATTMPRPNRLRSYPRRSECSRQSPHPLYRTLCISHQSVSPYGQYLYRKIASQR